MGLHIDLYITILLAGSVAILEFLHVIDAKILASATLATLALVANSLIRIGRRIQPRITICDDDHLNVDQLCEYIKTNKVKKARLIQYSGNKVTKVVQALLKMGARVDLLLQEPCSISQSPELCDFQIAQMRSFLGAAKHDFKNPQNLNIRFYSEQASLRGVLFDDDYLAVGWYTQRPEKDPSKRQWVYGHNNATIIAHLDNAETRVLAATFNEVFESLWDEATEVNLQENVDKILSGERSVVSGIVVEGHRVASGLATNNPYPGGTIEMQTPMFKNLGLDLTSFHKATLNVSIKPYMLAATTPDFTFFKVDWTDKHPPEDFSFWRCQVTIHGTKYDGWIYYPNPATKKRNFQAPTTIEVIAPLIPGLEYGNKVEISVNTGGFKYATILQGARHTPQPD